MKRFSEIAKIAKILADTPKGRQFHLTRHLNNYLKIKYGFNEKELSTK